VGLGKDLRRSMRLREPAASHRPGMFVLANAVGLAERGPITAPISILLHSLLLKAQSGPTGTGAGRLPSGASEEAIPTPPGNAQAVVPQLHGSQIDGFYCCISEWGDRHCSRGFRAALILAWAISNASIINLAWARAARITGRKCL